MTVFRAALALAFVLACAPALAGDTVGAPASDFTLNDLNGEAVTLSAHKGSPVLVVFWATWDKSSILSFRAIEELYGAHKAAGLVVLAPSTDDVRNAHKVKPFVDGRGWTFRVLQDPGSAAFKARFAGPELPGLTLVGRDGAVIWTAQGWAPGDETALAAKVEAALAGSP